MFSGYYYISLQLVMSELAAVNVFSLQDELLKIKKELTAKENEWKREKVMLVQKTEILSMEILELKHRESNLKKVNETMSVALNKMSNGNDEYNEFRGLIESLKSNTANSNNLDLMLKEERKKLAQEKEVYEMTMKLKLEEEYRQKESAMRGKLEKEMEERLSSKGHDNENYLKKQMIFEREKSERELKQIHYE